MNNGSAAMKTLFESISGLKGERVTLRRLTEDDVEAVFALCRENPLYYEYCPPFVTPDSIRRDMQALPPGKEARDKFYLGFFSGKKLIAVLDLINGYPNPGTAFIGFFMAAAPYQGRGTGTAIISELCAALKEQGFEEIRLCRVIGNPQPEAFWHKNGFTETGHPQSRGDRSVTVMRKELN